MLLLNVTTDKLQVITSAAVTVDVNASFIDITNADPPAMKGSTSGRQNTAITTATTTDIVAAPAASTVRNIKAINIRNKHASTAVDVTVQFNQNATLFELFKENLLAGEELQFVEGEGFFKTPAATSTLVTGSMSTAQIASHSADTYYLGIPVTSNGITRLQAGAYVDWTFGVTKTAGTAAPTFNIRFGTAGSTADTSRCLMTMAAQTAVADSGFIHVQAGFRAIGASAVIAGRVFLEHQLAVTGLNVTVNHHQLVQTIGASFDSTPNGSILGLSVNPGASAAWVVEAVSMDAVGFVF